MRNLAFGYSTRCNIRCEHCVAAGEKLSSSKMELDEAKESIKKLAAAGVTGISFTAGEPTIYYSDLLELLELCAIHKIYTRVVTNSLWATSYDMSYNNIATLQQSGLCQLRLSFSRWHQKHVPKQNIINAARACTRLGVDYFVSFVTDFSREDEEYEKYLISNSVKYFPEPLIYSGRAKSYLKDMVSTDFHDNRCAMNCYLAPDLNLYACCDAGSHFTRTNAFYLGNLGAESAQSLFAKFDKNPLFHCIRHIGLSSIASYSGILSSEITRYRKCELCEILFNTPSTFEKLEQNAQQLCNWHR